MSSFLKAIATASDFSARVFRRLRVSGARLRHHLGLPVRMPRVAGIARNFHHPIDVDQRTNLTSLYRDLFPDAVRKELDEARRLLQHRITLLGHEMVHGDNISWSRDPISGLEWGHGFSLDIPYRGPERLGDIKLPWELNKHQYFFTLGKASWLSGDPATALEILRQIDQWIEANPYYCGINWISALEVGTRAISWIMAFPFYAEHCDADFIRRLVCSLVQQLLFVEQHLSVGPFANTHLVGEAAALVAGGLFLDCRHSQRWLKRGLALLESEITRQVTSDGVHAERSIAYHRFFLDHYFLVQALLAANGRSLSAGTLSKIEQMTEFLMDVLFPDGTAPAFGDCDDARGLWARADAPNDFRSLLAMGAVIFRREDFKAIAAEVTEEILWLLGPAGIAKFQDLVLRHPRHESAAYPEGGYYVMRSGWEKGDAVMVFDCGPLGYGPAGHGHADALSFQLHATGYNYFPDSGTFSYNLDYRWRDRFRSTWAHNAIVVDQQDQSVPGDRMSWQRIATVRCRRWLSNRWFDLMDGEHEGYRRFPDPVMHRRVALFLKPDTWWLWDQLEADGAHHFDMLLHLRPDCRVGVEDAGGVLLHSPDGTSLHAWMMEAEGEITAPEIWVGGEDDEATWFSPCYGVRLPSTTLAVRQDFVGRKRLLTCFSGGSRVEQTRILSVRHFCIKTDKKGGAEEIFFYRMDAQPPEAIEDIDFDGQILYSRGLNEPSISICAYDFHKLSIPGLVAISSPAPIESLNLENGQCDLIIAPQHRAELDINIREGFRLLINGEHANIPETGTHVK